jgi:hypothetical protein
VGVGRRLGAPGTLPVIRGGFTSPLRHGWPYGSCPLGGHKIWWTVQADNEQAALSMPPHYVARRTVADEVQEVPQP